MTRLKILAAAAALAVPAAAMAQVYYVEPTPYAPHAYYEPSYSTYEAPPAYTVYERRYYVAPNGPDDGSAVHYGGYYNSDAVLAERVAAALSRDRRLDGAQVTVSARDGDVTLSGMGTLPQSQAARNVAQRIAGVGHVSGELSNSGG